MEPHVWFVRSFTAHASLRCRFATADEKDILPIVCSRHPGINTTRVVYKAGSYCIPPAEVVRFSAFAILGAEGSDY
jgi:hypothetical protein